jgi:hypothetical protein
MVSNLGIIIFHFSFFIFHFLFFIFYFLFFIVESFSVLRVPQECTPKYD